MNPTIHGFNTRNKLQLHKNINQPYNIPDCKKILNKLPEYIAELVLSKKKSYINLKKYLIDEAFNLIEEYMNS